MKIYAAHRGLVAAAGLLTLIASGCAVSDQLDLSDASVSGAGGSTGSGSGGTDQGSGGDVGTGGSVTGSGGATGSGGIIGTGGSGTGGKGTGGSGTGGSGTGGSGTGGNATGGTTGTGGIKGTGGTTGTGGIKGTGGTTGTGGVKGTGGTGGAAAPTFTQVYTTILVPFCGGSSCHNPGSQKGISFSSQSTAYTAVKGRVTPGNGAGSSFYTTCNSGSMPPGGPKLSSTNLALLKGWIDAGALNN